MQINEQVAYALVDALSNNLHPLERAAKKFEGGIKECFYTAVRKMQAAVKQSELKDALSLGVGANAVVWVMELAIAAFINALTDITTLTDKHEAFHALASRTEKLEKILFKAVKAGGKAVAPQLDMVFDEHNPLALDWAQRHAAELVVEMATEQRQAIRAVVSNGIENGVSYTDTAKILTRTIGLTERDSLAVMRLQVRLMHEGKKLATKSAERYADTLLRRRAKTIAVNETITASNEGQRQLWVQAEEKGLLSGREKKTIIQADPCPLCQTVTGEVVSIHGEFSLGLPPFHVRCRCIEGIV